MANIFAWSERYSVGHEQLDRQHRQILNLCEQVHALSPLDSSYSERIHDILNDMSAYAANHFRTEEAVLGAINYPDLAEQKQEHNDYFEGLTALLMESMSTVPSQKKLSAFLEDWWIDHILVSDMQYKVFFENA